MLSLLRSHAEQVKWPPKRREINNKQQSERPHGRPKAYKCLFSVYKYIVSDNISGFTVKLVFFVGETDLVALLGSRTIHS